MFRAWGRVGTKIGDSKLTTYEDKEDAIQEFVSTYEEKTGNLWSKRKKFEKLPGRFYPLDIDYGEVTTFEALKMLNKLYSVFCSLLGRI